MHVLLAGAAAFALAASGAAAQGQGKGYGNERSGGADQPRSAAGIAAVGGEAPPTRVHSLMDGCPPGLTAKGNDCAAPDQSKVEKRRGLFGVDYRPGLFGLAGYARGKYAYRDGYLIRYGDDGVAGWIPLLGGALGVGHLWPDGFESHDLPDYYVDYYGLGGPDRYRYADNVIYRVDPRDAAIVSIAALVTGDEFAVGQPLPHGYDVYNVPAIYRDRYPDTPGSIYRYADGYVYRVDPETRLVTAVIDLVS